MFFQSAKMIFNRYSPIRNCRISFLSVYDWPQGQIAISEYFSISVYDSARRKFIRRKKNFLTKSRNFGQILISGFFFKRVSLPLDPKNNKRIYTLITEWRVILFFSIRNVCSNLQIPTFVRMFIEVH